MFFWLRRMSFPSVSLCSVFFNDRSLVYKAARRWLDCSFSTLSQTLQRLPMSGRRSSHITPYLCAVRPTLTVNSVHGRERVTFNLIFWIILLFKILVYSLHTTNLLHDYDLAVVNIENSCWYISSRNQQSFDFQPAMIPNFISININNSTLTSFKQYIFLLL